MIFLYTLLLLFLGAAKMLIDRRVARLERKYFQTAKTVEDLVRQSSPKDSNSNKADPCQNAKRQLQLGLLAQKRDRLEAKHDAWQGTAQKFSKMVKRVREWKGKKLPYSLGVLDVSLVLYLIDYLGVGDYVSFNRLVQLVSSLITTNT